MKNELAYFLSRTNFLKNADFRHFNGTDFCLPKMRISAITRINLSLLKPNLMFRKSLLFRGISLYTIASVAITAITFALNALLVLLQTPQLTSVAMVMMTLLNVFVFWFTDSISDVLYSIRELQIRNKFFWLISLAVPCLLAIYLFLGNYSAVAVVLMCTFVIFGAYFAYIAPYLIKRSRLKAMKRAVKFAGHP